MKRSNKSLSFIVRRAMDRYDEWERLDFLRSDEESEEPRGIDLADFMPLDKEMSAKEEVQEVDPTPCDCEKTVEEPEEEPEEEKFFDVSPEAAEAFRRVIVPQIRARIDSADVEDLSKMFAEIESLGSGQNSRFENDLIYHKPISLEASTFYSQIKSIFRRWMAAFTFQD